MLEYGASPYFGEFGMLNIAGTSWGYRSAKTSTSGRVGFKS